MMNKLYTRISLIATLVIITLTVSFAHWHAQAERGSWRNEAAVTTNVAPATVPFATITVNTTADDNVVNGNCTLREAIIAANTHMAVDACAAGVAGLDTIEFSLGAGTPTINVLSALPTINEPVTINGNTGGSTRVELNGTGAGAGVTSLRLTNSGRESTIAGLVINRFGGIGIWMDFGSRNTVRNCYIGTDATGTPVPGYGNLAGVYLGAASANTIGGTSAAERNIIAGNGYGVATLGFDFGEPTMNAILGNSIFSNTALGNTVNIFVTRNKAFSCNKDAFGELNQSQLAS